ncbi:MAG TPA: response regulator transcription factor [Ignavibacteriaceae bacterium]|jgi:DNA-binding response OmpR family regulator|nr:MAG: Response regulator ArlR [Ignavibacteria bacterium ADurb.Bin266]OQY70568.1 MAG: DNA-binding response regulator [Ignavibacteriales bacterium UTCHB2]HQF43000.1 response regulator transcription factor [Ignavibacteriaceae bacterium]HQI42051.1 response regulator transcription factor [Ignavibacteriaceae bacterium]
MKLLIIEDNVELAESIYEFLDKENYQIDIAHNFANAEKLIIQNEFDCVLVDLMLPDGTGLDIVKILKKLQPKSGIIIITAKDTLDDKISGLDLGADDYLTKPFHLAELNARIKSVLRRRIYDGEDEIKLDCLTINTKLREVKVNATPIELTRREYDILIFLISNKERVITKESIVEHIWGDNINAFDNFDFVYTHIKNLRKKITDAGGKDNIQSVYGIGYKFIIE